MKVLGLIPARYASTRFPGKPLARLGTKPVIRHVWEKSKEAFEDVYIVTDDNRIALSADEFGAKVIMTSPEHKSGTDRCAEALATLQEKGMNPDIVVNIQGDEPFIKPGQLLQLTGLFKDPSVEIATLVKKIEKKEDIFDPNTPKVVFSHKGDALYFSRSPVPFVRDSVHDEWLKSHHFYKHIGLYAYRAAILREISLMEQGSLEKAESLEQLRWLQQGIHIRVAPTRYESIGIDTPEDLENAKLLLNKQ